MSFKACNLSADDRYYPLDISGYVDRRLERETRVHAILPFGASLGRCLYREIKKEKDEELVTTERLP